MKITRLEIDNFLMIGHAIGGLDDRGLVLVQGENNDDTSQNSNGSGKSSFADAISWCLYGFTARGETGDNVINRTAGKGCRVALELSDGDKLYRVARHRKHKEGKNRLTLERIDVEPAQDMTLGTDKLTQAAVDKLMGCTEEVFRSAVYMGQEQMPDLPSMTDKFLKTLIEEAAGIDKLASGLTHAKRMYADAKADRDQMVTRIDGNKRLVENLTTQLEESTRRKGEWETAQKARLEEKSTQLKTKKAEVDAFDDTTLKGEASDLEAKIKASEETIAGVQGERDQEKQLANELSKAQIALTNAESSFRQAGGDLKKANQRLEQIGEQIGKPCGECGKLYEEHDLETATELATKAASECKRKASEAAGPLREARDGVSAAQQALEKFRASMTNIDAEVAAQREYRAQLRIVQSKLSEHNDNVAELKRLALQYRELKSQDNPYSELVETASERLETAKQGITELEDKLVDLEAQLKTKEMVVKVFSEAGVRAHILDTVTPFLNDRTAHYLGTLTDGNVTALWQTLTPTAKGELREKFTIEASSRVGASTFKGLSGGEKRKVRLSCAMALQDLVASRATKPIELFVADEIDDSLDTAGHERLMTILEEKSRLRGTVLVISHNDLSDWIRQTVTVTKNGGRSTVAGEAIECR